MKRHRKCPRCEGIIEHIASFCKHCGLDLKKTTRRNMSKLLSFVAFLLMVLILVIIFAFPVYYYKPQMIEQIIPSITIGEVSCVWDEGTYRVCATIAWVGDEDVYAKAYIPGGEELEQSRKHYEKQFVYCQDVGDERGYRVARALLFDDEGLIKDIGEGVSCEGGTIVIPKSKVKKGIYSFRDHCSFTAQQLTRRTYGEGVYKLDFPDKVLSCKIEGRWVTNGDIILRQRGYCHKARGTFKSYADAYEQYVINDPGYFAWAGLTKQKMNPPAERYNGYVMYMNTCDNSYYQNKRYYVRTTVEGFGTHNLTFLWKYFDSSTWPQVDFIFDVDCKLQA